MHSLTMLYQLYEVTIKLRKATFIWCCSVHTAAVASRERRAGLTCTSCSFKTQSSTYRRTYNIMIPPAAPLSLAIQASGNKTFIKVKPHATRTDTYRRSCLFDIKKNTKFANFLVGEPWGKRKKRKRNLQGLRRHFVSRSHKQPPLKACHRSFFLGYTTTTDLCCLWSRGCPVASYC